MRSADWARQLNVAVSRKVAVEQPPDGRERGLYATDAVKAGEVVVRVPRGAAVVVQEGQPPPLATHLGASEWANMRWEARLAATLAMHDTDASSPFQEYIAHLPQRPPPRAPRWTPRELEALAYPPIARAAARAAARDDEDAARIAAASGGATTRERAAWALDMVHSRAICGLAGGGAVPDGPAGALPAALAAAAVAGGTAAGLAHVPLYAAAAWALAGAYAAYEFAPRPSAAAARRPVVEAYCLFPVIDAVNHASSAQPLSVECGGGADERDWVWTLRSTAALVDGEEVVAAYGDRTSNDELLLKYGFVEASNAHDSCVVECANGAAALLTRDGGETAGDPRALVGAALRQIQAFEAADTSTRLDDGEKEAIAKAFRREKTDVLRCAVAKLGGGPGQDAA